MSENNTPDRATELDSDIPTFDPNTPPTAAEPTDIYARAGRAAPQDIPPHSPSINPSPEPVLGEVPDMHAEDALDHPVRTPAAATQQAEIFEVSDRLASDAPISAYDDGAMGTDATQHLAAVQLAQPAPLTEPAPAGVPADFVVRDEVIVEKEVKRGTLDFGLLLLRIFFSLYLISHALIVFFRIGSSEGISELSAEFAAYPYGDILSIALPTIELTAGIFLLFGLLSPVAAALAIISTSFMALHTINIQDSLTFNTATETLWFGAFLSAIALVVQFTGPGRYSFDAGRSWSKRPLASSWVFVIVGLGAAAALWWFGAATNPFN
ncbi:DoxX family membrane protein [Corynebacterium sp. ES2794-CONJ1]|uniref:DoxX family protein n=1 Tax=unclassified Corynebacterium TaxID=2624378 RepID=UPI00216996A7|nr:MULTISPECIES: DoxX family membrane protein [unclassified Corynebacterium]MCS4489783.1 DoxX family membrane protein [Corynebacterium sp. ES2775-CONJ]MCS4491853.1 DoxX family membrane protein [Corynebacterium sp. ES2715-CONJ3]MCS4531958.1 DoxX family membrane protein [Corynebacterium sp. ES2730-CONJ]MCU9519359.1 DoxX family membrane protein [Corynebacterium sp. ES2794-CONJ1]